MNIVFFGTPTFSIPSLCVVHKLASNLLVVTRPDAPVGRRGRMKESPVAIEARRLGRTVLKPEYIDESFCHTLSQWKPDIAVLAAYGKILPKALLDIPPNGFLNVHPSLLPRHRGASPLQHTILSGDTETGVSIIRMTERIDAGPILAQKRLTLRGKETYGELSDVLAAFGADLLRETLSQYLAGTLHPTEQDHAHATTTSRLAKTHSQIDWTCNAERVERTIRAFSQHPGAWTLFSGQQLKILAGRVRQEQCEAPPGTVRVLNGLVTVVCGNGSVLAIETLQPSGKAPMEARAFAHGHPELLTAVFPSPETRDTSRA